ncbi:MAG TPA: T9SS type A sorting domain-containing protein [Candidatus Marinimicrobia bacterium]|nr:T9SS type A sorting domain-containing protein [Candidatus Neomarinimicrobiota bacterium]HIN26136.1 T9SS type A sorting domain-containing protein [Candidatus Neomarinimicrobiota bacterium]
MIRKSLLNLALIGAIVLPDIGLAQMAGNYNLVGVYNVYHYIIREMSNSLADSLDASYVLQAHWPSSESPLYSYTLATYAVGDTVGPTVVPLVNPALLGAFGIGLNTDVFEDGNMIISGTYPSLSTSNCETQVTIPAITDNATWASGGDPVLDEAALKATYGFGFVTSGIFANNMYAPNLAGGETYGVDYGAGTDHETWGKWISQYNADWSFVEAAEFYWEQIDDVSSDQGVDDQGELNGHLGLAAAFGDSSTVPYLAAAFPTLGLNVGNYPIIGGTGYDLDGDGAVDGVIPPPSLTTSGLEWGYLFDPTGADGIPFNGDEPFQFTGYYFTYNFLAAASALATTFGQFSDPAILVDTDADGVPDTHPFIVYYMQLGLDQVSALVATADSLANLGMQGLCVALGVPSLAPVLGPVVGDYAATTLTALLTAGVETVAAITQTAQATGAYAVGALAGAGVEVNDSDHDYVQGGNGRLVFQVGNNCVPRNQHVAVQSFWVNTGTAGVNSDESLIPKEFALYDNYPNPFNPTTQIAVDLPEAAATEITVWNIMGQRVATLYSGDLRAGHHTVNFNGRDYNGKQLTSGMYLYRVAAGKYNATKKMTLMK